MMSARWLTVLFGAALGLLGVVLPLWPLSALGVALLAVSGEWGSALVLGLALDLAWGVPVGALHALFFPFTAFAVLLALLCAWSGRYFIDRTPPEWL